MSLTLMKHSIIIVQYIYTTVMRSGSGSIGSHSTCFSHEHCSGRVRLFSGLEWTSGLTQTACCLWAYGKDRNGKRKRKRKTETETENGNGKRKRKIGNEMEALARGLVYNNNARASYRYSASK